MLTGIGGDGWRQATDAIAKETGLPISAVSIGPSCEYDDPFGDWARVSEVDDDGAVLVRPDQVVAWRSKSGVKDGAGALRAALRQILGT